jgi:predicted RNA binding protein YcfA (HicA-like mRNA interferase family)
MAQIVGERMVRALRRLGWQLERQSGSHAVLTRAGKNPVTVPIHRGKTLKEGTARSVLKQAGIAEDAFFDVY